MQSNQIDKINLLIDYLKQRQPFSNVAICKAFKVSAAISTVLKNAGYLEKDRNGLFVATELIDSLTYNTYHNLMNEYSRSMKGKYKKSFAAKQTLSIEEFLRNKNSKNESKELAAAIYTLIKPYL